MTKTQNLEIRNPKSETSPNEQIGNSQIWDPSVSSFFLPHLNLFRISDFGFRICRTPIDWSLVILLMILLSNCATASQPATSLFKQASQAYIAGGFEQS